MQTIANNDLISDIKHKPEFKIYKDFVRRSVKVMLDVSDEEFVAGVNSEFNDLNLRTFLVDNSKFILVVNKVVNVDLNENKIGFYLGLDELEQSKGEAIVFYKKADMDIGKLQIQRNYLKSILNILNLGPISEDYNIFQVFHDCIKNAFIPIFKNIKNSLSSTDDGSEGFQKMQADQMFVNSIYKKFADLEVTIYQKIRRSAVPKVELAFDSDIEKIVKECHDRNEMVNADQVPKRLLDNDEFVENLSENVQKWMTQAQMLANFGNDNKVESVNNEINFWINFHENLWDVSKQLKKEEVNLTVDILRNKKKINMMTSIETDLNLPTKISNAEQIAKIMKSFPVNQLMTSNNFKEITTEILNVFGQVKKLIELNFYSNLRLKNFLEVLSAEFVEKMVNISEEMGLMKMEYSKLVETTKSITNILGKWNFEVQKITENITVYRKVDLFKNSPLVERNKGLTNRLNKLNDIKREYETIKLIYEKTYERDIKFNEQLYKLNFPTVENINREYEAFNEIDVLDLSKEGEEQLKKTEEHFQKQIIEIDKIFVEKIHFLFTHSKTNQEKFHIFYKFFHMLSRPYIKQELKVHQDELLAIIENEIQELIGKFKQESEGTRNSLLTKKYKIPGLINSIIWSDQVLNNLKENIEKLKFILGENWDTTTKGKEISSIFDNFSKQILKNIQDIMTYTKNKYDRKNDEKVLIVRKRPDGNGMELYLNLNQETRICVKAMKFIFSLDQELAKRHYITYKFRICAWPAYISGYLLSDAVKTFNDLTLHLNEEMTPLLANLLRDVYQKVKNSFNFVWFGDENKKDDSSLEKFAVSFGSAVNNLEKMYNYVKQKFNEIDTALENLKSDQNMEKLSQNIKEIQDIINDFETKDLKNLDKFVENLNQKLESTLMEKLIKLIKLWTYEFVHYDIDKQNKNLYDHKLIINPTAHEVVVKNQQIFLEPPIEYSRLYWMNHLQMLISRVCSVPRIMRKEKLARSDGNIENFKDLVFKLSADVMVEAYDKLNKCLDSSEKYLQNWKQYQALWELDIKKIYEVLGDNTEMWQTVLQEIKVGQKSFDYSSNSVRFGPLTINYKVAQKRINNKYDSLHYEILTEFGKNMHTAFVKFYNEISDNREKVEAIEFQDSSNIITAISEMRTCKSYMDKWQHDLARFKDGQELLIVQDYIFPDNWHDFSLLESEWRRFEQTYKIKEELYTSEYNSIKNRLLKEEDDLVKKVNEIELLWKNTKPFAGSLHPKKALEAIESLERAISTNKDSFTKINQAKELLNLPLIDLSTINSITEESENLKECWTEIDKCWSRVDKIMETPIKVANPVKFHQVYDEILEQLNGLPNKFRTFDPVVKKKDEITSLKKTNKLLKELKTDAIKEIHWEQILKNIRLAKKYKNLIVGDLYKHKILGYEKVIMETIHLAQGELVLENMIKKIKDFWNAEEFQLSQYQQKCMLIRGWDDMMTKIEDDLAQITSMKLSQHFKTFEEEIKSWNDKLVTLQATLDIWVNVQRKWVYLEGIFFGSSDIAQQLPNEYAKFKSIDNDFVSLMKKTANKLKILDVILNTPNLQKSLQLLYDSLEKIQKKLSEYLETQRQLFSRFYFVGDEDLLEIMGNSKEVTNIQKYFSKMFNSINYVENKDNGTLLQGMRSREDETVNFYVPFNISDYKKINEWLDELENQMKTSLSIYFEESIRDWQKLESFDIRGLVDNNPAQSVLIAFQTYWTFLVEEGNLKAVEDQLLGILDFMADEVLTNLPKLTRSKYEQLITEFVHKRDVTRTLALSSDFALSSFSWQAQMRFYNMVEEEKPHERLNIRMGNSEFQYGFEYLGITEKLVQTPLTDKCYFTLTQALWLRMGGAPFGPAGTGKTESVKALGGCLGRFVLVFNCDETFNFKAMGRIFIGLCQVGAWGCFDEFNRLEERILSAVSQQIMSIQMGLREKTAKIDLMSKEIKLNPNMGIFVTMNPGYAGRSNLPENLKQLFRQMAMIKPDRELIAQVMLFSQGFKSAEQLSGKVVSLFELCNDQLSSQPHYDFGLRALKSVLNSAGGLKRRAINEDREKANQPIEEQQIILRSYCDTVVPKLVADDAPLLESLVKGIFPSAKIPHIEDEMLAVAINEECNRRNLVKSDRFMEKIFQLNQILKLQHGIMLVGPTGCGKTAAWKVLLSALGKVDGIKGESYVIDPKAITKDELYGKLDDTSMEWTDGIFTHVLRKIYENARGESSKRHWIIFDGDVDPEWVENLNSVLDDNKLLTLPNGERLSIPPNVKIMFEVESLKYATLATVSRCGMVWFSSDVLRPEEIFYHYLQRLKQDIYDQELNEQTVFNDTRENCANSIEPLLFGSYLNTIFKDNNIEIDKQKSPIYIALKLIRGKEHVMEFSDIRSLEALFSLIRKGIERCVEYNENFKEFPLENAILAKYMKNWTILSMNWAFAGDLKLLKRADFYKEWSAAVRDINIDLPYVDEKTTLIDYGVDIKTGQWVPWKDKVPEVDIDENQVDNADLIIPTVDTLRHQDILCSWLLEKRPFIICGPPGSGKTMTLMSTLKNLPDYDMIFVNFSSSTTPGLILKQFEHYCEYVKSQSGITLKPKNLNRNLVLFCDEINLPDEDKYGTQFIITFLRQLKEQGGFWRNSDKQWVSLERIQYVGACNPPTDAGRHPLSPRFLRHCPLMLVDFPGYPSLIQIYGTFNKAMLKKNPDIRDEWKNLTSAMVEYYTQSQKRFTSDMQPHYIYSPRELTRWKYAIYEALEGVNNKSDLVRLWAHEALRLFEDRLVTEDEKEWCEEAIDRIAQQSFGIQDDTLERPILYSTYLTKAYKSVGIEELRKYVIAKLHQFNEEEYSIQLVVFDSVLEHILRIDRVLRQPIGHMLLVGASGVGKTTLSRFVSWMNGLSVFQIKAGRNFTLVDFDANLREVMKRAGCKREKITFIFDESNVLSVAFLERMNALLASGEVPGLFEGEEYAALINSYKENQENNKRLESDEEIYATFIKNVQRNLHVVFTMNPANPDFSNRTASSPAIFNRCVIDWFGDWSNEALYQVARELTENLDIPDNSIKDSENSTHDVIVQLIVKTHNLVKSLNDQLKKGAKRFNYITPRDFIDFIKHLTELHRQKKTILEEQQYHLNSGLNQLKKTEEKVQELDQSLKKYKIELDAKEVEANEKMEMMVVGQKQAEENEEKLKKLMIKLEAKQKEIAERSVIVQADLDKAGPALEAAKNSVSNIGKDELNDIKSLLKPPVLIRLTMEGVTYLLTGKKNEWKDVLSIMKRPDFIKKILELDVDNVKDNIKKKVTQEYLKNPEWDIKKITKAFKAAGALAEWLESQLSYADILSKVDPLRKEIQSLQEEAVVLENEKTQNETNLNELQGTIENYKKEYTVLITNVQHIKQEMQKVNNKVEKSKKLLENLSSEKNRWTDSSNGFTDQLASMTGDVIICSAFLTYCGFFDQLYRNLLLTTWKHYLDKYGLKYKKELSISEYLSTPSERMVWQSHKLPADELCSQNAIIMKRYNRYPLVIDPSGQAVEFILSYYSERKIEKTSFEDKDFIKVLEKCLRFGLPLLIQNVEKVDPMLNALLNKEVVKQGGRVLVRVGDQEIDFNKDFILFMLTKNGDAKFTPDLCSRVTFVNFTVTQSSLENQCINLYLKHERPDVEKKRLDLLKLQGEYLLKLRELEDDLLTKISEQEGSILENEPLLKTLDNLKSKADEITKQMKESNIVLEEVENTTNSYRRLAFLSAKVYFVIQNFAQISVMYQYSFKFYMKIIYDLLESNEKLKSIPAENYDERIETILNQLFVCVYYKIEPSILENDKILVALRFCQLKLGNKHAQKFKTLFEPVNIVETTWYNVLPGKLSNQQLIQLENLSTKQDFTQLKSSIMNNETEWLNYISDAENDTPPLDWIANDDEITAQLIKVILCTILKPSIAFLEIKKLIKNVLGPQFLAVSVYTLKNLVQQDSDQNSPIFLASAPGFDPSIKIDQLGKEIGKKYESIALGSAEGYEQAQKTFDKATKVGGWVVLKNVHLAISFLKDLEQKMVKIKLHKDFRLFLVSEFNDKLPTTLLRQSAKMIFELPEGIKSNVLRTLSSIFSANKMNAEPKERARLYFQIIWLHAVIMERRRYTPIGWSKPYEFSEADLRCTIEIVDQFLEKGGDALSHLHALRSIIANNIYGGKIDNEFDLKILKALVQQYINEDFYNPQHFYVKEGDDIILKNFEANTYDEFFNWIDNLKENESPLWAGLPYSAEDVLKKQKLELLIHKLQTIQDLNEEEIEVIKESKDEDEAGNQLKWLLELSKRCKTYLKLLPNDIPLLQRNAQLISNPLFRFLEREVVICSKLLKVVKSTLNDLIEMAEGRLQPLQDLKRLAKLIYAGEVPKEWKKYTVADINVSLWIQDFKNRVEQVINLCKTDNWQRKGLNMGLLLFPEAFLTASRQFTAQNNKLSLDELELSISLCDENNVDENSFLVKGMYIEGIRWTDNGIEAHKDISFPLKNLKFSWVKNNSVDKKQLKENQILIPLYLNAQRTTLLTSIKFDIVDSKLSETILYQRGIALIAWEV